MRALFTLGSIQLLGEQLANKGKWKVKILALVNQPIANSVQLLRQVQDMHRYQLKQIRPVSSILILATDVYVY